MRSVHSGNQEACATFQMGSTLEQGQQCDPTTLFHIANPQTVTPESQHVRHITVL